MVDRLRDQCRKLDLRNLIDASLAVGLAVAKERADLRRGPACRKRRRRRNGDAQRDQE